MKERAKHHRARPWRVHDIAADFQLLDVWRFALGGRRADLDDFLRCLWCVTEQLGDSRLGAARIRIGQALGWDAREHTLPIPGCRETTVAERLLPADRAADRAKPDAASPVRSPTVKTVYLFRDEALFEVSNSTIHALLHVAIVRGSKQHASLAVYIKSRGPLSRIYMAAISPFRHLIIYPALVRRVARLWAQGARAREQPPATAITAR